jgi:hypothetical protein
MTVFGSKGLPQYVYTRSVPMVRVSCKNRGGVHRDSCMCCYVEGLGKR